MLIMLYVSRKIPPEEQCSFESLFWHCRDWIDWMFLCCASTLILHWSNRISPKISLVWVKTENVCNFMILVALKKTASDSTMMWIQRPGWFCMLVCRVTLGRLLSWPWRFWRSWRSGMETLRWNAEVHRRGVPWYECISEAPRLRQSKSWPLYAYPIPRLSCAKFSACCALNCANACSKEPHTQLVDLFVSRRFSSKRTSNTSNICVRRTIRIA